MSVEDNKAFAKEYIETHLLGLVRGDVEHVRDHMTPDAVYHTPSVTPEEDHLDTLHSEGAALRDAFADVELEVDVLLGEGDLVAAHWTARARHEGGFPHHTGHVEASGKDVEISGLSLYRCRDGKIAEVWMYSNLSDTLRSAAAA